MAPVQAHLPPLRDRLEDVPARGAALARELGHEGGVPSDAIAREVGRGLAGNVRELRAIVEAALARAPVAPPSGPWAAEPLSYHEAKARLPDDFEHRYLEGSMARQHGVVLHAAREAGLGRNHLARLLEKHDLE
ncbi:MAG TPA: hypothetical protein VIL20_25460 [Sandaracinaceae bacterium]